jgi:hypothetical protein
MTESAEKAIDIARATCYECPFNDRSVWDAYWSCQGTFHIKMFKKPEQLQQILQYFAEAKSLRKQGKCARDSYIFPIMDLANYFGVKKNSVTCSK